ncbi:putative lipoprotein [Bacteroides fragilis str. 1009-4-F |nr:putative lipoprotein [Bacteroides fragilis str. 1009-4-F \
MFSDPTGLVQPGDNNHSSRIARCVWLPVSFMGQADTLCIHFPLPAKGTAKKKII